MTVRWTGPGFVVQSMLREGGQTYEFPDDVAEELIGRGLCVRVVAPVRPVLSLKPTPRASRLRDADTSRGEE